MYIGTSEWSFFTPGPGNLVSTFRYFILGPNVQTWKNSLYIDQIVSPDAHAVLRTTATICVTAPYWRTPRDWESLGVELCHYELYISN
jgi:hypothetical protein